MNPVKRALLFSLCLLPIAAVAGVFVSYYQLDTLPADMVAQMPADMTPALLAVISAVQATAYALVCGFVGCILAEKTGLLKPLRLEKRHLLAALAVGVSGGVILALDHWTFGSVIDGIQQINQRSLTVVGLVASVLYGGILEEVIMRLFFLTLIAFLLWKLFARKADRDHIPGGIFVAANVIAALAFAAGHLPSTIALFGELTPLLVLRCFLLNGGLGLLFGRLYRRCGLAYAMAAHALCHIVGKTILFLFA